MIERIEYIKRLDSRRWNVLVKIITGIRRCGKLVLLFNLFYQHLINNGVNPEHIIQIKLDERTDAKFRNPNTLCDFISNIVKCKPFEKFYVFIDEVQLIEKIKIEGIESTIGLYEVLNN